MKCSDALIVSITAAALYTANALSEEETELLAAAATQFGDTLATILISRSSMDKCNPSLNKCGYGEKAKLL